MLKEFKDFVAGGNVMDMAIGIIIGAAFGKIVASLVNDILMPIVGNMMGGVDFGQLFTHLGDSTVATLAEATELGLPVIRQGAFIQSIIDFLIIGFTIFMVVKMINKSKKPEEAAPVDTKECPKCISTIPLKATKCAFCASDV